VGTVASALSHLLVESRLSGDVLVLGDPAVVVGGLEPGHGPIIEEERGTAVVIRGGSASVWVAGPTAVRQLVVVFRHDVLDGTPSYVGDIDCPSGRLVVGTPEAVAAWGADVEPDGELPAQARAYRPSRHHCGLIVVARVPAGTHPVLAVAGADGPDALVVEVAADELRRAG
jgi:hypothetical protein